MNEAQEELKQWENTDTESMDFSKLEQQLSSDIEMNLQELEDLKLDGQKIGDPASLGETINNVIWEQFMAQIGVQSGEEFIDENRGLKLDLRSKAHIQTVENFEKGEIATHNELSKEQLQHNYDRMANTPHKVFRKAYVNPKMDEILPRAGKLNEEGIETVRDIYTGKQISTKTKLEDGSNNPKSAEREHVKPSAEVYSNPSLQMSQTDEGLASVINNPNNLQGYTTGERNLRKSDKTANEMEDQDKNKHWEAANERAENYIKQKEKEGEERLKAEGEASRKAEAKRMGNATLKAVLMELLASLVKDIVKKLVKWFMSAEKKFKTFIEAVKKSIHDFFANIKQRIKEAANTALTTIATAILGPIVGVIKKAWIFLKQGYNSVKEAILFLKNPDNANMPFSLKLLEVGKIIIAGLTAGGAIVLGEVIEKTLISVPFFAITIPFFGSLASIIGMFMGALVSGLIGALALNLIDRLIAKKLKAINTEEQINKGTEIINKQTTLIDLDKSKLENAGSRSSSNIHDRHRLLDLATTEIKSKTNKSKQSNVEKLDDIKKMLNK